MNDSGLTTTLKELSTNEKAIVCAFSVLTDRIQRLNKEDRDDLFQVVQGYMKCSSDEDRHASEKAFMEILEVRMFEVQTMHLGEYEQLSRPEGYDRWVTFVSDKVKELRKENKLTQDQLAKLSGLPQSHISRIEGGKLSPSNETLVKLAKVFDVPVSKLDPSEE